jgi:NADH-quinone oxidoreductase subunit K
MIMAVPIEFYLILSAFMFSVGIIGVLTRRNAIVVFMCVELMLNSANLTLIAFSSYLGDTVGQLFVFFVMAVAAAEAAVGLAIIIAIFRNKLTINIDEINILKW